MLGLCSNSSMPPFLGKGQVVCCIFILLSQDSDSGVIGLLSDCTFWMNPHPLRSSPFLSFLLLLDFLALKLLLVRSHQAEIIIVKCLIQRRNKCDESGS